MPIPNPVVLVRFVEDVEVGRHSRLGRPAGQSDLPAEEIADSRALCRLGGDGLSFSTVIVHLAPRMKVLQREGEGNDDGVRDADGCEVPRKH